MKSMKIEWREVQFAIRGQPAGGTQARHRNKRKEMVQE
jgi:hypothetical protein